MLLQDSKELGVGPGDLNGFRLALSSWSPMGRALGSAGSVSPQCNLSKPWVYVSKPQQGCDRKPGTRVQHKRAGQPGHKEGTVS